MPSISRLDFKIHTRCTIKCSYFRLLTDGTHFIASPARDHRPLHPQPSSSARCPTTKGTRYFSPRLCGVSKRWSTSNCADISVDDIDVDVSELPFNSASSIGLVDLHCSVFEFRFVACFLPSSIHVQIAGVSAEGIVVLSQQYAGRLVSVTPREQKPLLTVCISLFIVNKRL